MKLSVARDCYYGRSGDASSVARQIAFAGIAVIWVFNRATPERPVGLPEELVHVAFLLVLALALDLLQYVVGSAIWGIFARIHESRLRHRIKEDPDEDASPYLNWPAIGLFWSKLFVLFWGYGELLAYLWRVTSA